jgi:hypothetical protein
MYKFCVELVREQPDALDLDYVSSMGDKSPHPLFHIRSILSHLRCFFLPTMAFSYQTEQHHDMYHRGGSGILRARAAFPDLLVSDIILLLCLQGNRGFHTFLSAGWWRQLVGVQILKVWHCPISNRNQALYQVVSPATHLVSRFTRLRNSDASDVKEIKKSTGLARDCQHSAMCENSSLRLRPPIAPFCLSTL